MLQCTQLDLEKRTESHAGRKNFPKHIMKLWSTFKFTSLGKEPRILSNTILQVNQASVFIKLHSLPKKNGPYRYARYPF